MEATDNLEVSKMVADAVRAAVAVQSDALGQMLADDAVATAEEKAAHAGHGGGMDDCTPSAGGGSAKTPWVYVKGKGWTNACVQIGNWIYSCDNIPGISTNTPGDHYLTINMTDDTMEITTDNQSEGVYGVVSLHIGSIDNDGNQTWGIYTMPTVFAWT